MFDRSLIGHGVLAALSVAVAFIAWSTPATSLSPGDRPKIVADNLGKLQSVRWSEPGAGEQATRVEIARNAAGALEVTVTGVGDKAESPRHFPGSKRAQELMESLASLEGERSLGVVGERERVEFGLSGASAKTLELGFQQRPVELTVGAEAYGSGAYYVSPPSGEVFMVGSRVLSPLRHGAAVLLDRRVIGVERDDIRRIRVSTPERQREWVHRHPDDPAKAFFADPAEPDQRSEDATGWLDRALRLRTREVVDAEPEGAPAMTLEVFGASDVLARVELWKKNADGKVYAKSSRFERPLELNRATVERLFEDATSVLRDSSP